MDKNSPGSKAEATRRGKEDAVTLRQQGRGEIPSDVLGSYTGTPVDGGVPVQDADDL